jgi:hypothetical protein
MPEQPKQDPAKEAKDVVEANVKVTEAAEKVNKGEQKAK